MVEFVNEKLQEVKSSGNVIGTERIVIMAALNIADELLAYKQRNKDYTESVGSVVQIAFKQKLTAYLTGNES